MTSSPSSTQRFEEGLGMLFAHCHPSLAQSRLAGQRCSITRPVTCWATLRPNDGRQIKDLTPAAEVKEGNREPRCQPVSQQDYKAALVTQAAAHSSPMLPAPSQRLAAHCETCRCWLAIAPSLPLSATLKLTQRLRSGSWTSSNCIDCRQVQLCGYFIELSTCSRKRSK
jgi:hypothetical protein